MKKLSINPSSAIVLPGTSHLDRSQKSIEDIINNLRPDSDMIEPEVIYDM
jgi:hypothetical protein